MTPRSETVTISDQCFWPERRGLSAHIVDPDGRDETQYPFRGLHDSEAVIWVVDDPINGRTGLHPVYARSWTCVIDREHLVTDGCEHDYDMTTILWSNPPAFRCKRCGHLKHPDGLTP